MTLDDSRATIHALQAEVERLRDERAVLRARLVACRPRVGVCPWPLLRDTLMVLEALGDENDRLGSLKVDAPKDGYPRQWLVEYVRDDLKPRVEAALRPTPRCACQWEAGDSPCPMHGEEST